MIPYACSTPYTPFGVSYPPRRRCLMQQFSQQEQRALSTCLLTLYTPPSSTSFATQVLHALPTVIPADSLLDIIGFKCCHRSSVNQKLAAGDDKQRGDCASRTQSPSHDPRCLLWSGARHL